MIPKGNITNGMASTFTWTAAYPAGLTGGAANGIGNVAGTLNNVTGGTLNAVYTVTPSSGGCTGATFTITVPVRSLPVGGNSSQAAVCSGTAFSFNPQANISNGMASTFAWTAVYPAGLTGGAANGTGNVAGTLTNVSGGLLNAVYTVTPSSGGCSGAAFTITVPVNSAPTPVISGIANVCRTDVVTYSTPVVAAHSYLWTSVLGTISSNNVNPVTITWNTVGAGSVTLTETINATGCSATTAPYPVTVNSGAPVAAPAFTSGALNICRNGTLNIDVTDVATATSYVWDYSWVGAAGSEDASTAVSQASISLAGLAPGTYTVTAAGRNGCGRGPWMAPVHTFNINDIPDLASLSNTVCSDAVSAITFSIANPGATIYRAYL